MSTNKQLRFFPPSFIEHKVRMQARIKKEKENRKTVKILNKMECGNFIASVLGRVVVCHTSLSL